VREEEKLKSELCCELVNGLNHYNARTNCFGTTDSAMTSSMNVAIIVLMGHLGS